MSTDDRKKTACVTGGNGYIASVLIKMLLEKGYAVKTTMTWRRTPTSKPETNSIASWQKEVIEPAVRGTLNVMRSCVKAGTVKRVILTSSAASVIRTQLQGDGHVLGEESWSDVSTSPPPSLVSGYTRGHASVQVQAYPVSKVLLEKAASGFAEEHGVSLVTVCPVITVGAAPAPSARTSVPNCLSLLSGDEAEFGVLRAMEMATGTVALVHVDDVCRGEVFLAEQEAAAGRYLCCGLNTTILELARFLSEKYPQYTVKTNLLSGDLLEKPRVHVSSGKLVKEGFDCKYKMLDGMYDDMIDYGKALGILP
ncbi:unnamed protein product [Miscanthus lutarioriparius]|uniref:NAD-dependent epimerase/dehydratase domain-containing protein n=1 Tax=Miscanthus lutarioriparius TaxID=422564 RepID=A0A811QP32_9POAL|nr:unnamed protein product [Miscanthus lutarioriparius]